MLNKDFKIENKLYDGYICNVCEEQALTGRYGAYCFNQTEHHENGEHYQIISITDKEFYDSMPQY